MQRITPFLWFDSQAEEAANFYTSIFKNSKIGTVSHYSDEAAQASGRPKGSVMLVTFQLDGQEFMALNGGPQYKFTEAISFVANCETQQEIDELWEKLSTGGAEISCGWLKDKFGLCWQVVPAVLNKLLGSGDPQRTARVMSALLQMNKLIIADLQRAFDQA